MKNTKYKILAGFFWLIIWQILSLLMSVKILLPGPLDVCVTLFNLIFTKVYWISVGFSFVRIIGGFLIALGLGIILSVLSFLRPTVGILLSPLVSVIKSVPVASFVILALVWLNSKSLTVFIVVLMVFPIVYTNVYEGLFSVDVQLIEMAEVYKVPFKRRFKAIYLHHLKPYIRSALLLGFGFCFKAGTAAEVIGTPKGSIGERLYLTKIHLETPELFAYTFTIILISYLTEKILLALYDKATFGV